MSAPTVIMQYFQSVWRNLAERFLLQNEATESSDNYVLGHLMLAI